MSQVDSTQPFLQFCKSSTRSTYAAKLSESGQNSWICPIVDLHGSHPPARRQMWCLDWQRLKWVHMNGWQSMHTCKTRVYHACAQHNAITIQQLEHNVKLQYTTSIAKEIPKHNLSSINPLTISSASLFKEHMQKLVRSQPISVHMQLSSSEPEHCQQIDGCELVFIG